MAKISLKYLRVVLASLLFILFSFKVVSIVKAKFMDKSSVSVEKDSNGDEKKDGNDNDENLKCKILGQDLFCYDHAYQLSPKLIELANICKNYLHTYLSDKYTTILTPPPDFA